MYSHVSYVRGEGTGCTHKDQAVAEHCGSGQVCSQHMLSTCARTISGPDGACGGRQILNS